MVWYSGIVAIARPTGRFARESYYSPRRGGLRLTRAAPQAPATGPGVQTCRSIWSRQACPRAPQGPTRVARPARQRLTRARDGTPRARATPPAHAHDRTPGAISRLRPATVVRR